MTRKIRSDKGIIRGRRTEETKPIRVPVSLVVIVRAFIKKLVTKNEQGN